MPNKLFFFQWIARLLHRHRFINRYRGVLAEYQKGEREKFQALGNIQECKDCRINRFVPNIRGLSTVECIKVLLCILLLTNGCVSIGYHQRKIKEAYDEGYHRGKAVWRNYQ